jgi:hypothetical protein
VRNISSSLGSGFAGFGWASAMVVQAPQNVFLCLCNC